MIKYAIALGVFLAVAGLARWALVHGRQLPGNRVRHAKVRLHLRLHPGRGYATVLELWLRWGRLAAFRKSGRIRHSLSVWQRVCWPGSIRCSPAAPSGGMGCGCRWKSTCW